MKNAVSEQQKMFESLDMDALDDIRDEMEEMRDEAEYMNELMNRDYDVDVNEADLDEQLRAFQQQYSSEIKAKQAQQVNRSYVNHNVS